MNAPSTVRWEPGLFERFEQAMLGSLTGAAPTEPMERCFSQWTTIYQSWAHQRFSTYSRGGGDWPPLADSTVKARAARLNQRARARALARRREERRLREIEYYAGYRATKGRPKGKRINRAWGSSGIVVSLARAGMKILWDRLGTIFMALDPTSGGSHGGASERIPYGVRVGFGGPALHPGTNRTIAQIAAYHQFGGGNLPPRRLLAPPPPEVLAQMKTALQTAMARIWKDVSAAFRS